jgi:hypothetical protein
MQTKPLTVGDGSPEATYVIQIIKFYDRKFDSGTVIK